MLIQYFCYFTLVIAVKSYKRSTHTQEIFAFAAANIVSELIHLHHYFSNAMVCTRIYSSFLIKHVMVTVYKVQPKSPSVSSVDTGHFKLISWTSLHM
jgi:predicted transcriptional regulator